MAVGEDADNAGYPLVPDSGENGKVRWGAQEINRTRDFIAQVKNLIPTTKAAFRTKTGISNGTADPVDANGEDGDIYLKVID